MAQVRGSCRACTILAASPDLQLLASSFRLVQVVTCATRCTIHATSWATPLVTLAIVLRHLTVLNASRYASLAEMAFWSDISIRPVRRAIALVHLIPGAFRVAVGVAWYDRFVTRHVSCVCALGSCAQPFSCGRAHSFHYRVVQGG